MGSKPAYTQWLKTTVTFGCHCSMGWLGSPETSLSGVSHGVTEAQMCWMPVTHRPSSWCWLSGGGSTKVVTSMWPQHGRWVRGGRSLRYFRDQGKSSKTSCRSGPRKYIASLLPYSFGQKWIAEPAQIQEEAGMQRCEHWRHGSLGDRLKISYHTTFIDWGTQEFKS